MTDRKNQLTALAERVEANEHVIDEKLRLEVEGALTHGAMICEQILTSLDAAQKLHDELLPGWRLYDLGQSKDRKAWWVVLTDDLNRATDVQAPTPAAAWVAAILRALASHEKIEECTECNGMGVVDSGDNNPAQCPTCKV